MKRYVTDKLVSRGLGDGGKDNVTVVMGKVREGII